MWINQGVAGRFQGKVFELLGRIVDMVGAQTGIGNQVILPQTVATEDGGGAVQSRGRQSNMAVESSDQVQSRRKRHGTIRVTGQCGRRYLLLAGFAKPQQRTEQIIDRRDVAELAASDGAGDQAV